MCVCIYYALITKLLKDDKKSHYSVYFLENTLHKNFFSLYSGIKCHFDNNCSIMVRTVFVTKQNLENCLNVNNIQKFKKGNIYKSRKIEIKNTESMVHLLAVGKST